MKFFAAISLLSALVACGTAPAPTPSVSSTWLPFQRGLPTQATVLALAVDPLDSAAFAPYTLTQFADTKPFDSISVAIETFFGTPESYAAVKEPLRRQIAEARDRLARKRAALAQSLPSEGEIDRLRVSGELILAYASQIKAGQNTLIEQAAALAAQFSQARDDLRVDVIVTPRRNVRRVRGGRTGMVTVRNEQVVTVVPTGRAFLRKPNLSDSHLPELRR